MNLLVLAHPRSGHHAFIDWYCSWLGKPIKHVNDPEIRGKALIRHGRTSGNKRGSMEVGEPTGGDLLSLLQKHKFKSYVDITGDWSGAAFIAARSKAFHYFEADKNKFEGAKLHLEPFQKRGNFYNVGCAAETSWDKGDKYVELDAMTLKPDLIRIGSGALGILFGAIDTIKRYYPWIAVDTSEGERDICHLMGWLGYEGLEAGDGVTLFIK